MDTRPYLNRNLIANASFYLAFAAASARAILSIQDDPGFWFMVGMLGFYLVLLLVEPALISRNLAFLHGITALQTGIALVLLLFIDKLDYFSLLVHPTLRSQYPELSKKDRFKFGFLGSDC